MVRCRLTPQFVADRLLVALGNEKFYNATNPFDFMVRRDDQMEHLLTLTRISSRCRSAETLAA